MPHDFIGDPELLHNNDAKLETRKPIEAGMSYDNPEAVLKVLIEAKDFEDLMAKYSLEDTETWDRSIIAGAKLVLYFEFCTRENLLLAEDIKNKPISREEKIERMGTAVKVKKIFLGKLGPNVRNSIEKITQLAKENDLTLDSTISVNRAAIAYYEYQKNIQPKSQPYIEIIQSFYPRLLAKAAKADM